MIDISKQNGEIEELIEQYALTITPCFNDEDGESEQEDNKWMTRLYFKGLGPFLDNNYLEFVLSYFI